MALTADDQLEISEGGTPRQPLPLEDCGFIGDLQSAALVGRDGSVDWLCLPRFDRRRVVAALLGTEQHGRWLLAPACEALARTRRYRPGTLALETVSAAEADVKPAAG